MIPIATTTITAVDVSANQSEDPYDSPPQSPVTVATNVRAAIGAPSGTTTLTGGQRVEFSARFACDPCAITAGNQITDAQGNNWEVLWAKRYTGLGLDFMDGELRLTQGAST